MENINFYEIKAVLNSKDDFVKVYSSSYFLNNPKLAYNAPQSNENIESIVLEILENGVKDKEDVKKILAWKMGKIKHKESDKDFVYYCDWSDGFKVKRYGKEITGFEKFAEYIRDKFYEFRKILIDDNADPKKVYDEIRQNAPSGFGPVYLITLLFFISSAKYPIYDQYAMKALIALEEDKKPGDEIKYKELANCDSSKIDEIFELYNVYIEKLHRLFGEEYKRDRNIDRALWVYGHLFG